MRPFAAYVPYVGRTVSDPPWGRDRVSILVSDDEPVIRTPLRTVHDKDGRTTYEPTLADVLLPDGKNVNHTLVRDGWCWWYRKYAPRNTMLEGLERDTR